MREKDEMKRHHHERKAKWEGENNYLIFFYIYMVRVNFQPWKCATRKLAPWGVGSRIECVLARTPAFTRVDIHARPIIRIRMHTRVYFSYPRRILSTTPWDKGSLLYGNSKCVQDKSRNGQVELLIYIAYAFFLNIHLQICIYIYIMQILYANFLKKNSIPFRFFWHQ